MKYRHSLRTRITLTFFLFGTLLMAVVAIGVHNAIESIEERVIKENLEKELDNYRQHYRENPHLPLPQTASMTAYLVGPDEKSQLPDHLRQLKTGTYEFDHDGKTLQVIVDHLNGQEIILALDATLFERREKQIFNAVLLVMIVASLLSLWLGYALSQRAIAPVTNLAKSVAVLKPDKPHEKLSARFIDDEVGELAQTFDRYLDRLQDFIGREQEFTANASHELRTPLTIIKGAVELLNSDPELLPRNRRVLQRIERATHAMSQMVETLLLLAREGEITEEDVSRVSVVVNAVMDDSNHLLNDKPVEMELQCKQDFGLQAPDAILSILFGNILRNAIAYTNEGSVVVTINSPVISITDTGKGIEEEDLQMIFKRHFRAGDEESTGSGLGLAIVQRICDRYGWQIAVHSSPGKGTQVSIDFKNSVDLLP